MHKLKCEKCSLVYGKYLTLINKVVHGGNDTSILIVNKQIKYFNDNLNLVKSDLVADLLRFAGEVKHSVILKLIEHNIDYEIFSASLDKFSTGLILLNLDYSDILNQCSFIITTMAEKLTDAVEIYIDYIRTCFHLMKKGNIHVLCAGPNIEGNVFKIMNNATGLTNDVVAFDSCSWEFEYDRCIRVVKSVVPDDLSEINVICHGIKYLDFFPKIMACNKWDQGIRDLVKDRIVLSVEHRSVQRPSLVSYYPFSQDKTRGVYCDWSATYALKFLQNFSRVTFPKIRATSDNETAKYIVETEREVCWCTIVECDCSLFEVIHDICWLQEFVIDDQPYSNIKLGQSCFMCNTGNVAVGYSYHDYCLMSHNCSVNHENILNGQIHKHLKCINVKLKLSSDEELYNYIKNYNQRDDNLSSIFSYQPIKNPHQYRKGIIRRICNPYVDRTIKEPMLGMILNDHGSNFAVGSTAGNIMLDEFSTISEESEIHHALLYNSYYDDVTYTAVIEDKLCSLSANANDEGDDAEKDTIDKQKIDSVFEAREIKRNELASNKGAVKRIGNKNKRQNRKSKKRK